MNDLQRIRENLRVVRRIMSADGSPTYSECGTIARILNLPADYVRSEGVFDEWDNVLRYYGDVSLKLQEMIPPYMLLPGFCGEKSVNDWLITIGNLPAQEVEFQRARWFAFAVADIRITPLETYDDEERVDVEITFTPEFAELVEAEREKRGNAGDSLPKPYTMTRIMEDFCRRRGVDERDEIRKALDESAGESFDAAFLAGFDSDTQ